MTRKALRRLRNADVVIYDHLVPVEILSEARPSAELIFAGGKPRGRDRDQVRINDLMISRAREGKRVVRLKGGDPFVFGRGGEEASALVEAGIPWETVPGVTSPIAVLAYAGIPVTDRRYSSSFAVITGRNGGDADDHKTRIRTLAQSADTLVFLMATSNLDEIVPEVLLAGLDPTTPAAVVQEGTTARQRTVRAPLSDIIEEAQRARIHSPSILVVGRVVALAASLNWYERLPLFGLKIAIAGECQESSELVSSLSDLGADIEEITKQQIIEPEDWGPLDRAVENLRRYSYLLFGSGPAVHMTTRRIWEKGHDIRVLCAVPIAVAGAEAKAALKENRLRAEIELVSIDENKSLTPLTSMESSSGPILYPCAEDRSGGNWDAQNHSGVELERVPAYREVRRSFLDEETSARSVDFDLIIYTSPWSVRHLNEELDASESILRGIPALGIGPGTASAAAAIGLEVTKEFGESNWEAIGQWIAQWKALDGRVSGT